MNVKRILCSLALIYFCVSLSCLGGVTVEKGNQTPTLSPDDMAEVPSGDYQVGCKSKPGEEIASCGLSLPFEVVHVDEYYIDKFEVTNSKYSECVKAGHCNFPTQFGSSTRESYYENSEFANYPVVLVNWNDAFAFCEWAGKRLPTEIEWEIAALGNSGNTYPWGNIKPTCQIANVNECVGDTTEVGSYPDGVSPFGVFDMVGNVSEWTRDWFNANGNNQSPYPNPTDPKAETSKAVRGWFANPKTRWGWGFSLSSVNIGFRCVANLP